jgi:hypothetical protein
MNWLYNGFKQSAYREYYFNEPTCTLEIKHHPQQRAIRLRSGQHQSVFYLDTPPHSSGKKLITNQYGMELGSLLFRYADETEGMIMMYGERYNFSFAQQDGHMRLTITEPGSNFILQQCTIPAAAMPRLNTPERCSWLAGFCWCIQVHELVPVQN